MTQPGRRPRQALNSLEVDLGRTWLRACLSGPSGRVLRRCRVAAVPWRLLPEALDRLRPRLGFGKLGRLRVGATGLWTAAERAQARRLLRGWAARVIALSDVELAHQAVFGGAPGILVVGSTGSVALARDRRGRVRRAGGWGPLLGDEGSGFWIGREALHEASLRRRLRLDPLALARRAAPARAAAGLAPRVLRLARRNPRARRIRDEAARSLALLAAEAGKGLRWGGKAPVSWWGGLFRDPGFKNEFLAALRRAGLRAAPSARDFDSLRSSKMPERRTACALPAKQRVKSSPEGD